MAPGLLRDTRAQSMTYLLAGATVVMFAGAYAVLQGPVDKLLTASLDNCVTQACQDGQGYVSDAWTWLPLVAAGLVAVMIISASIYMSRRP